MPRKDEILSELLARKTREIVARSGNYAAFLRTAARNYKYTFREQALIHAQRPMPQPVRKSISGTVWDAG